MKRKLLLAMLIVLASVLLLASCIDGVVIPGVTPGTTNNGGNTDTNNSGDNTNNNGGNNTNTNVSCVVTYKYNNKAVYTQSVISGRPLSSQQIAEKDNYASNGVKFTDFYSDAAMTVPFDFDAPITQNTTVYCRIFHTVTYMYGSTKVAEHKVDSIGGYLTQAQCDEAVRMSNVYTGLYTDKNKTVEFDPTAEVKKSFTVYCQLLCVVSYKYVDSEGTTHDLAGLKQRVDSIEGFTDEQKAQIESFVFRGFTFDYFYTDETMSRAFDFDKAPRNDVVIYCERDETKAGPNVRWVLSSDKKTITFTGSGEMYEYMYNTSVPWYSYGATVENILIDEGITSVAGCAFYKFPHISSVKLPGTIEKIYKNAFYQSSITEINFPKSLKTIGASAFAGCTGLTHLDFNMGLEHISDGAFQDCSSITTVVLTNTIMGFGASAFERCTGIASAYYIGTEAEYNAIDISVSNFWINQLAHKYYISQEKPKEPGPYWYYDDAGNICKWYHTIWYMASDKETVPFVTDYVDVDTGINQNNVNFMKNSTGYRGYQFVSWKLKGSASNYTMRVGTVLTDDIKLVGNRGNLCGDNVIWKIDGTVLTISKKSASVADGRMWDFEGPTDAPWYSRRNSITKVIISSGVTYIGRYAFVEIFDQNNSYGSFTYIDIPKSITEMNERSIYNCQHLLYIYYAGTPIELLGDAENGIEPIIKGMDKLVCLDISRVYSNVTGMDFSELGEGAYWANITTSATINNNGRVAWYYNDGVLTVGGGNESHIMINYTSHADTPWYSYRDEVTSVIINKNVTTIGHYSFENMTTVVSIVVPKNLAKTSATAFIGTGYYETQLSEKGVVYLYTDGEVIHRFAHLIKVDPARVSELFVIPDRTASIAENAFEGCSAIKKLVFSKDIRTDAVYSTALVGLTGLEAIYFDGLVSSWVNYKNVVGKVPADVKVYHYFAQKPSASVLESNGLTIDECWYWNSANNEPLLWKDATSSVGEIEE